MFNISGFLNITVKLLPADGNNRISMLAQGVCVINAEREKTQILIKFSITGLMRFISHAEAMRLFGRACVRAPLPMVFSGGFNPRPKLSLPLPKSVNLECMDDLLVVQVWTYSSEIDLHKWRDELNVQLPEGTKVKDISVSSSLKAPQPESVTYIFDVRTEYIKQVERNANGVVDSESIVLERKKPKKRKVRKINVRKFIEYIKIDEGQVLFKNKVSPRGTIRVDEMMQLLDLDLDKLTGPIRRESVEWNGL